MIYKNGSFIFKDISCNGIYESVVCIGNSNYIMLNFGSSNGVLDKSCLWKWSWPYKHEVHHQAPKGRDVWIVWARVEWCMWFFLGWIYQKGAFNRKCEIGDDLFDLIHTDICGPFRFATKHGEWYCVTFIDDFN